MNKRMKKYSGQAIAIVMVVLVVATVIGASLYSRMVRNRGEIVETRESQRALEQADTILDAFISSDLVALQDKISTVLGSDSDGDGCVSFSSLSNLRGFLESVNPGVFDDISYSAAWCDEGQDSASSLQGKICYADASSSIEYDVGEVMAINLSDVTLAGSCTARLYFTGAGSVDDYLFTVKKVYVDKATGNVQPYRLNPASNIDDMRLYCLNSGGTDTCDDAVAPRASIEDNLAFGEYIDINLNETNLYEVRVIPLRGKLGVAMVPVGAGCGNILNNYEISAKVNCKGDAREKQVVIPNQNNMGYPAIFDYTIYNANGTLSPN